MHHHSAQSSAPQSSAPHSSALQLAEDLQQAQECSRGSTPTPLGLSAARAAPQATALARHAATERDAPRAGDPAAGRCVGEARDGRQVLLKDVAGPARHPCRSAAGCPLVFRDKAELLVCVAFQNGEGRPYGCWRDLGRAGRAPDRNGGSSMA